MPTTEFCNSPTNALSEKSSAALDFVNAIAETCEHYGCVFIRVDRKGFVFVRIAQPLNAAQRGKLLLDLEAVLKKLDIGLSVWHEPLGDKNSLRHFRGVMVTTSEKDIW